MRIKFLNFEGDLIHEHQWGRFKRREGSLVVFIAAAVFLHALFWIVWYFWVAPYPIAITIPLPFGLGPLQDYVWPLANLLILLINIALIYLIYKKDIFASWLLVGINLFLQILVLVITAYLVSYSGL